MSVALDAPSNGPVTAAGDPVPPSSAVGSFAANVARLLLPLVLASGVVLVLWIAFLEAFDISPLVGKRPADVWAHLVTDADAPANRTAIGDALLITFRDAGIGFVGGLVAALLVAGGFVLARSVEQTFMPIAMLLRSVPLVAMTPLIVLVFGRGLLGVTVICGIVVFFPALVNIVTGFRSASQMSLDLVRAYGGSSWTALRKVALPTALPALFASARISVPGALIGALLAEWLATGRGVGAELLKATGGFRYTELWAMVVVVTASSIVLYALVGVLESVVLARFGTTAGRTATR